MIIDYSTWRPRNRADLAGVHGVLRYVAHDYHKAISPAEMTQLHKWGIATGLVFEDAADRATSGKAGGAADGEFARTQAEILGVPHQALIWCAIDFDVPDYAPGSSDPMAKLGPLGDYLAAFGAAVHPYSMGAYGGYWLVSRALDAGLTSSAWQAAAWSGGQIDGRVLLYQPGVTLHGGNWDLDLMGAEDWGQFRAVTRWEFGPGA